MTHSSTQLPSQDVPAVSPAVTPPSRRTDRYEIAAWIIVAAALLFFFWQHLIAGLLVGLVFYKTLDWIAALIVRHVPPNAVRPVALVIGMLFTAAVVAGAIVLMIGMMRAQKSTLPALMTRMAEILESTRLWITGIGGEDLFPDAVRDAEDLKIIVTGWLKENAQLLRIAGSTIGFAVLHITMGFIAAILVFFRRIAVAGEEKSHGLLGYWLEQKVWRFSDSFGRVVMAQVKISAINTVLTAAYILVILPLTGNALPFAPTIILITFICGLIPVLGNLISNSVIVIVSMGTSVGLAVASLAYLVVIHKLEYFINSKIVGIEIESQPWEIVIALIVGEAAFGIPGIIMAPIVYAFIKSELRAKQLV